MSNHEKTQNQTAVTELETGDTVVYGGVPHRVIAKTPVYDTVDGEMITVVLQDVNRDFARPEAFLATRQMTRIEAPANTW